MSNVKVNGNIYNDVTSIKLMKADDSGYAEYMEGATTGGDYMLELLNGQVENSFKGYENSELTGTACLSWLSGLNAPDAEVILPNVTRIEGGLDHNGKAKLKSIRVPKAAAFEKGNMNTWFQCKGTIEFVDFSGLTGGTFNQTFYGGTYGTLKLGKYPGGKNGTFQNATITNLIWNNPDLTASVMATENGGLNQAKSITNAYVPDTLYDEIKALMDAGSLTSVTNLYKVSEWSDD